jgi:hypothetical protein
MHQEPVSIRLLYLKSGLALTSSSLTGRKLFDSLDRLADGNSMLAWTVLGDDQLDSMQKRFRSEFVSWHDVLEFQPNLIYIEGGLFAGDNEWKLPRWLADRLLAAGTTIIVADVDVNAAIRHKPHYEEAAHWFGARIDYGRNDVASPVYCLDQEHFDESFQTIIITPDEMFGVSDWLKSIYEGVRQIAVGLPVRILASTDIIASGNLATTKTLQSDIFVDRTNACPFGSIVSHGPGHVVLLAALVSSDYTTERFPDTVTWLTNLARLTVAKSTADYLRYQRRNRVTQSQRDRSLDALKLHPRVTEVAGTLFEDAHYKQAVLEAFIALVGDVREKSGITDEKI